MNKRSNVLKLSRNSNVVVVVVVNYPVAIAKPNCIDRCGNVSIPFPFGTTPDCYGNYSFFVTCNQTYHPGPKLFVKNSTIEITDISLDGQLTVLQYIARECYAPNTTGDDDNPFISFDFTVNTTANKFTIVAVMHMPISMAGGSATELHTGCSAFCTDGDIPEDGWRGPARVWLLYAFLAEETAFSFSRENVARLKSVTRLPMVADWAIGNMTCEEAKKNSSAYACKSLNSMCYKPDNGYGYRCSCQEGYQGNPYLVDGCQGYHGDGQNCSPGDSGESLVLKVVAGIAPAIIILLLVAFLLYWEHKRRGFNKMKQKFFFKMVALGQGGFGTVYKGILPDNSIVAIKKSKRIDLDQRERLFQVLDDNILGDDRNIREQITEVARLAQGCLNVKGEERPSMKEVAMELEGLRHGGKHSWAQTDQCKAEEMESLLGVDGGYNGISIDGYGDSTSVGFDSLRNSVVSPMSGGR
ncbi:Wall-associated receptor kinase [Sesamum angolense]|uniref:Wall-associated receptor kinase n=1 Tax=Sesamum angolense TaxID=2727404 RepID=A0AAE1WDH7_9LAMI|nr:Wall-associated receptor kinase [Sesamum angolense]